MENTVRAQTLEQALAQLDEICRAPDSELAVAAPGVAAEVLALGELVLEWWLRAHDVTPTTGTSEGFRLLALHRQGAKNDPSFNACRETCRELVYHYNLICLEPAHGDVARRVRLGAMVARHLALFIGGKLEVAGLGEFCCSSRTLRERDDAAPSTAPTF